MLYLESGHRVISPNCQWFLVFNSWSFFSGPLFVLLRDFLLEGLDLPSLHTALRMVNREPRRSLPVKYTPYRKSSHQVYPLSVSIRLLSTLVEPDLRNTEISVYLSGQTFFTRPIFQPFLCLKSRWLIIYSQFYMLCIVVNLYGFLFCVPIWLLEN